MKGSWIPLLSQISQKEWVGIDVKNTLRGKKEKVLPWILSIYSQTYLHLIISVMAFSGPCSSFSPPVPHPVCELYQWWQMNYLVILPVIFFFWWKTENSLVWIKKTIFVFGVKLIKTMLFHCPSNMDLRDYKQLLFLVKWNTVQQYFNSILPDYQLFQASVKISITGKMNYVLFVKLAPTCPSSWAGKDSLTVQHRCCCLWL